MNKLLADSMKQVAIQKSEVNDVDAKCVVQEERISDMTAALGDLEALREADAELLADLQTQMSTIEDNPKCDSLQGVRIGPLSLMGSTFCA